MMYVSRARSPQLCHLLQQTRKHEERTNEMCVLLSSRAVLVLGGYTVPANPLHAAGNASTESTTQSMSSATTIRSKPATSAA